MSDDEIQEDGFSDKYQSETGVLRTCTLGCTKIANIPKYKSTYLRSISSFGMFCDNHILDLSRKVEPFRWKLSETKGKVLKINVGQNFWLECQIPRVKVHICQNFFETNTNQFCWAIFKTLS